MNIKIDLEALQNDEGLYSENDVKTLEKATGMQWSELTKQADSTPKGSPSAWDTRTKLKFIEEHGREAYLKALKND